MKVGNITRRVAGESDESACPGRDTGGHDVGRPSVQGAEGSGLGDAAGAGRLPRWAVPGGRAGTAETAAT